MKRMLRIVLWFRAVLFLLLIFSVQVSSIAAWSSGSIEPGSEAEKWVFDEVSAGRVADLKRKFDNASERVLSASFLEQLIQNPSGAIYRRGIHIENAVIGETLDLSHSDVTHDLKLINFVFERGVELYENHFMQNVDLRGSMFFSTVDFHGSQVDRDFSLDSAEFIGPASFSSMRIGGSLFATNVRFSNPDRAPTFSSVNVQKHLSISGSVFQGGVDFGDAIVGLNFGADGASFRKESNFSSMSVGKNLFIRNAVFDGLVLFRFTQIGHSFEAIGAKFVDKDKMADFNSVKTGAYLFVRNAVFEGPVDFGFAEVGINFEAQDAQFNNHEQYVDFGHMRVEDILYLKRSVFAGPVNFEGLHCSVLHMEDVMWPPDSEVNIGGASYQSITVLRDGKDAWRELLAVLDKSPYNAQTYKTLEDVFEIHGYSERADDVYVAYKIREGNEVLVPYSTQWLFNRFMYYFVRHGRSPELAILWSAIIVGIGWIVFRKKDGMVYVANSTNTTIIYRRGTHGALGRKITSIRRENPRPYNPFWYSLDLFLIVIDLGYDRRWAPKPDRKWAVHYARIQMLLGWILIPIALLSITGLIK